MFACLFLQRLPREIRVPLARVDHKDPKELARQVDKLWALHDNNAGGSVAAVQQDGVEGIFCFVCVYSTAHAGTNCKRTLHMR
jgi:hypothetical protein